MVPPTVVFKSSHAAAIRLFGAVALGRACPEQQPEPGAASKEINPFVEIVTVE